MGILDGDGRLHNWCLGCGLPPDPPRPQLAIRLDDSVAIAGQTAADIVDYRLDYGKVNAISYHRIIARSAL